MTVTKDEQEPQPDPAARQLRRELFSDDLVDELLARAGDRGVALTGKGGFLPEMIKAVLERGMDAELTSHLGYERGDRAGHGSGNSRNGTTPKTLGTEVGDIDLDQPRDRNSTFASALVPKGARRLGGLEDMIISLYAGGMTVRDIQHHLASTLGTELSHETISNVTEAVADEVAEWQSRPLEAFYPVIFLDALMVKVRDGAHVANSSAHIAVGVDMDGIKTVLGIWIQATEGAKFWASVCSQLANRGVRDVLIVLLSRRADRVPRSDRGDRGDLAARDGPNLRRAPDPGLDAVRSYGDRKAVAAALRPIYTAPNEDAALAALAAFTESRWGSKYPAAVASWEAAWERFTPFLVFPPALRRVIYTTNSIESLNYQLRKIIKNRGHFPSDAAAIEAAVARDPQHRGQAGPSPRERSRHPQRPTPHGPRPTRRRRHRPGLEDRPGRARPHLSRAHQRPPLRPPPTQMPYTDTLTPSRLVCRSGGTTWAVLALYRGAGEIFFTAQDGARLADAGAAAADAVRSSLFADPSPSAGAGGILPSVLLVDGSDVVAGSSAAADTFVEDLGGLDHGALPAGVLAVAASARARDAMASARIRGRDGWVRVQGLPLDGAESGRVVLTLAAASPAEVGSMTVAAKGLTAREHDVVGLVLQGASTAVIASALHLSAHTVQDHLKAVFAKLGIRSRRELVAALGAA